MTELISKTRRISTKGKVLVNVGDVVQPDTIIAQGTVQNPETHELKLISLLKVDPEVVTNHLLKTEGDQVERDEVLAVSRSFFTRQTRVARSPLNGWIESVSSVTGRMVLRGNPLDLKVSAYLPGTVTEIIPDEGAVIETDGILHEGVFGVGGETYGELVLGVENPDLHLSSRDIKPDFKDKIIIGGALVTLDALREAVKVGAKGIITGSVDQKDLTYFLGYEIGVPVTGNEDIGLTLILTGGFGDIPMESSMFEFLSSNTGKPVCINGTTHIRSRSLRPEIILTSI